MPSVPPPVRIFVAMPGSTMGERAEWTDIEEIKEQLLEPAANELGMKLGRKAQLFIEKDKVLSGPIHPSMFREAADADVYIADLTGANANVFLELGVRWALKDGVTILISQDDPDKVKFNVVGNRIIRYGDGPRVLKNAIGQIVEAASNGLLDPPPVDSPVRSSLSLLQVSRDELNALHQALDDKQKEIDRLKAERADELVAAARTAAPAQAIEYLRQAIDRDPVNPRARYELGVALRKAADYPEAIAQLREAVKLKDGWAEAWRELGVALNKAGQYTDAEKAFDRAIELDDRDAETWATVGGLKRRLARSPAGSAFDWTRLRESRNAYRRASELRANDSYALLNEAKLDLLLSTEEPSTRPAVLGRLSELEDLARYEARTGDPWKLFDLADTYLLTGRTGEGLDTLRSAVEHIDPLERENYLTSYISPLRDFLAVGVLDQPAASGVREAIDIAEQAIKAAKR